MSKLARENGGEGASWLSGGHVSQVQMIEIINLVENGFYNWECEWFAISFDLTSSQLLGIRSATIQNLYRPIDR